MGDGGRTRELEAKRPVISANSVLQGASLIEAHLAAPVLQEAATREQMRRNGDISLVIYEREAPVRG